MRFTILLLSLVLSSPVLAQSLSSEDIARMLDEARPVENPYATLLNDPDPARGIGAMRIMMESGDPALVRLALEHGLLSANPHVQVAALDGYLRTRPRLLVTIDASEGVNNELARLARDADATVAEDGRIFFRWQLGAYDEKADCIFDGASDECAFFLNTNGIFLTVRRGYPLRGKVTITPDGDVIGNPSIGNARYPIHIQLLQ